MMKKAITQSIKVLKKLRRGLDDEEESPLTSLNPANKKGQKPVKRPRKRISKMSESERECQKRKPQCFIQLQFFIGGQTIINKTKKIGDARSRVRERHSVPTEVLMRLNEVESSDSSISDSSDDSESEQAIPKPSSAKVISNESKPHPSK